MPDSTATEDRQAINELTSRLALLLDARDWDALEQLFTDPVYWDRTSLFGGEPETQSPAGLVGGLACVADRAELRPHRQAAPLGLPRSV